MVKFLTNIDHELRTPLSQVVAPIEEMMQNHTNIKHSRNYQSSSIYRNFNYLLIRINQFIDLIKLNVRQLQFNLQTIDVLEVENQVLLPTNDIEVMDLLVDPEKHDFLCRKDAYDSCQVPELENKDKDLTIVIIGDNAELRIFLSDSLSLSYNCYEVGNGREGYGLIVKIIPDIVILDDHMPKIDGYELCERMKANSKTCHIPIILITDINASEQIVAGYKKGADSCIAKPFRMTILKAQISRLIKNRELIKEKYIKQNFMVEISSSNLTRDDVFIIQLRQLLEENLSDSDFNVHELSSGLNMSQTTLYRKMKTLTSLSPIEFMLLFKMQRACELLSTSNSIRAVGNSLGFKSLSYFSKCFKKQFGVTPVVFRQKGLQDNAA